MSTTGYRKCKHCKQFFKPRNRNAHHQRYCNTADCRAASKRASQRKWSAKNPDYHWGAEQVQRVREWRRKHPGYWRRKPGRPPRPPADALQDVLILQGFDRESVSTFRNCLHKEVSQPLQDLISAQHAVICGLAATITGDALQEVIVETLDACYERGKRIGVPVSRGYGTTAHYPIEEKHHERTRTAATRSPPPHSATVQLD